MSAPFGGGGPGDVELDGEIIAGLHDLEEGTGRTGAVAGILDTFRQDAISRVADLHAAVDDRDPGRVRAIAHSLEGSALTFGAAAVSRHCRTLRDLAVDQRLGDAEGVLHRLVIDLDATLSALDAEFGPR